MIPSSSTYGSCLGSTTWSLRRSAARYGNFPPRVPFEEVADRLVSAGVEIYHVRRVHMASLEEYWIPECKVMFSLISEYQMKDFPALRLGDVNAVATAAGVDFQAERLTRYR